jgi:hypothetical protein
MLMHYVHRTMTKNLVCFYDPATYNKAIRDDGCRRPHIICLSKYVICTLWSENRLYCP